MSIKIQVISDLHLEFRKALPKIFKPLKLSSQSISCDEKLIPLKFSQKPQFVQAPYLFLAGDIG
jgi:hypothetical protein